MVSVMELSETFRRVADRWIKSATFYEKRDAYRREPTVPKDYFNGCISKVDHYLSKDEIVLLQEIFHEQLDLEF